MTLLEKAISAGSRRSPMAANEDMKDLVLAYLSDRVTISQCSRAINGDAKVNTGMSMTYAHLLRAAQAMYREGELVAAKSKARLAQVVR